MAYYLVLYHGDDITKANWNCYTREIGNAIIEGDPLKKGKSLTKDKVIEADRQDVSGFVIIKAKDLQEAMELSRGAPSLQDGGSADVYCMVDTAD